MASSATGDGQLIADPGPAFDPDAELEEDPGALNGNQPPDAGEPVVEDVGWTREKIATKLQIQGALTHKAIGRGQTDFLWTEQEIRAVAPGLASILNRFPTTRAAAGVSDELDVVFGLGGYIARSVNERRRVIAAEMTPNASEPPKDEPAPAPPPPAAPDVGPDFDPGYETPDMS
ncbi:MAG TPA: hypothetical protein VG348_15870 [Acidimicrobiia bacterium]|jgi:hypothetical protein|nr:hypothetical protein [Acidimicrobiia bacterium]